MTEAIFMDDAYLKSCEAFVTKVSEQGVELDRSVFYPTGGGQPGDMGRIIRADGAAIDVTNTTKGSSPNSILHEALNANTTLSVGDKVFAEIAWNRRYRHMRMHTCLHLLCSLLPYAVTGGQIGDCKGRLDFNISEKKLDKESIMTELNELILQNHSVNQNWISSAVLDEKPELVRTMSVKPPRGTGRIRLMKIGENVDLQPCGGTHVRTTREIGPVTIRKIENKGKQNRRINLDLLPDSC